MANSVKKEVKNPAQKQEIQLMKSKNYQFKANSSAPYMIDGKVYKVSGEIGQILVDNKYGEILK
tara:strand:- start:705 stop:896 length:192 start_codon:yes stop_codon:yes gene_type:complete